MIPEPVRPSLTLLESHIHAVSVSYKHKQSATMNLAISQAWLVIIVWSNSLPLHYVILFV